MIIFTLFTFIQLVSVLPYVSAQISPQSLEENSASQTPPSAPPSDNPYGIRITNPSTGDQVFINGSDYFDSRGAKLTIEGFSVSDNGNLTGCEVSVIANSIFPYQAANGSGPLGNSDYSKWTYQFGSNYANLQEGSNKITSKLSCESGIAKAHYSVNLTGTEFNGTFPESSTTFTLTGDTENNTLNSPSLNLSSKTQNNLEVNTNVASDSSLDLPITNIEIISPSNGDMVNMDKPFVINGSSSYPPDYDCEVLFANGNSSGVIAPASANASNFKKATAAGGNGTNDFRNWNIVIEPDSNSIKNGSQSLTAKLHCYTPLSSVKFAKVNVIGNSSKPVELKSMDVSIDKTGASANQKIIVGVNDAISNQPLVDVKITGSINDNSFTGTTDVEGKYTVIIPTDVLDSAASIDVSLTASADGYKMKKTSTTFEGSPELPEESTSANRDDRINEEELANKIFDDVQNQLNEQGINIPLPFG